MIGDFDKEADGETQDASGPESGHGGGSQSHVSSEARSTSVFDRQGKKFTQHDLRLKLDMINAKKKHEESVPQGQMRNDPSSRIVRRKPRFMKNMGTPVRPHLRIKGHKLIKRW